MVIKVYFMIGDRMQFGFTLQESVDWTFEWSVIFVGPRHLIVPLKCVRHRAV